MKSTNVYLSSDTIEEIIEQNSVKQNKIRIGNNRVKETPRIIKYGKMDDTKTLEVNDLNLCQAIPAKKKL